METEDPGNERRQGGRALDRALDALALSPKRPSSRAFPLASLGARAIRFAAPRSPSRRDAALLSSAEQLGRSLDRSAIESSALREQAHLILALVSCHWAEDDELSHPSRDAALVAAIAFAGSASSNARAAFAVEDRLIGLLNDRGLGDDARASIRTLVSGVDVASLARSLEPALERAMAAPLPLARARGRTRRRGAKRS
ncbi:MAG TPA: hypothetical protein VFF73_31135 [Planctomycetota bacterium]|nr:hypothetical protein [Planctomycetota bacterium]